jgi:hypothetical protein
MSNALYSQQEMPLSALFPQEIPFAVRCSLFGQEMPFDAPFPPWGATQCSQVHQVVLRPGPGYPSQGTRGTRPKNYNSKRVDLPLRSKGSQGVGGGE